MAAAERFQLFVFGSISTLVGLAIASASLLTQPKRLLLRSIVYLALDKRVPLMIPAVYIACKNHLPRILSRGFVSLPETVFLGRRLPMCEHVTRLHNAAWIDCDVSFVDVPNDAFFIDHEGRTISKALLLVEDPIILDHSAFEIAEQRKGDPNLLCKFAVGGNAVYTHAENLSIG